MAIITPEILLDREIGITVEEKLILATWPRAANGASTDIRRDQLVDLFGMPERKATKAMESLVGKKIVEKQRGRKGLGQSMDICYRLLDQAVMSIHFGNRVRGRCQHLEVLAIILDMKTPLVAALPDEADDSPACEEARESKERLKGYRKEDFLQAGEVRKSKASLEARLLLAVLWAHADQFGIVCSLSQSDLKALTGLTEAQLKYQLDRLKVFGYLYAVVPGHKGCDLLSPQKTAYFLSLTHPKIKSQLPVIVHCIEFGLEKKWVLAALELEIVAGKKWNRHFLNELKRHGLGPEMPLFEGTHKVIGTFLWLARDRSHTLRNLCQSKLDECVSLVLTECWSVIDISWTSINTGLGSNETLNESESDPPLPEIPELRGLIESNFPSRRYLAEYEALKAEALDSCAEGGRFFEPELLRDFLYVLVLYVASKVKTTLIRVAGEELDEYAHRLMPRQRFDTFTVVSRGERVREMKISHFHVSWKGVREVDPPRSK